MTVRLSKRKMIPVHQTRRVKGVTKSPQPTPWKAHGGKMSVEEGSAEAKRLQGRGWEVFVHYVEV